jgi:hypothetical protein
VSGIQRGFNVFISGAGYPAKCLAIDGRNIIEIFPLFRCDPFAADEIFVLALELNHGAICIWICVYHINLPHQLVMCDGIMPRLPNVQKGTFVPGTHKSGYGTIQ